MNRPLPLLPGLIFLLTGLTLWAVASGFADSFQRRLPRHLLEQFGIHAFLLITALLALGLVWLIVAGVNRLINGWKRQRGGKE